MEFPEFQIVVGKSQNGYEDLAYFYDNESMFYASLKLQYLSTTLYETELWYMDEARCLITAPDRKHINNQHIYYYFILKKSVKGKLLPFFNYGKFQCHNRSGLEMPILLFSNQEEQEKFEEWVNDNQTVIRLVEEGTINNAIYEHILNNARYDRMDRENGIKNIAIAFGIYRRWRKLS